VSDGAFKRKGTLALATRTRAQVTLTRHLRCSTSPPMPL